MACNLPVLTYEYIDYTIWTTSLSEYNAWIANFQGSFPTGPGTIITSPFNATLTFNAPLNLASDNIDYNAAPNKGVIVSALNITYHRGQNAPDINLNWQINVATGPCINNSPPLQSLPPVDVIWLGKFTYIPPVEQQQPPQPSPVSKRRWINGFEYEFGAEGTGNSGFAITRDASRTIDGLGAAVRRSINKNYQRNVNVFQSGFTTSSSWERIYVRVRNFDPTNRIDIWKSTSSPSPTNGIRLYINTNGSLNCYNVNSSNVETLLGTSAVIFTKDVFVRLDILVNYNSQSVGGSGRFRLYINAALIFDFTVVAASGGLGSNSSLHIGTLLGTQQLAVGNTWELDFDDWLNADIPNVLGVEGLNSLDWILGTHIKAIRVDGGSTLGNFSGQVEMLNQMMSPLNTSSTSRLVSTTANDLVTGVTNLTLQSFVGYLFFNISAIISKFGFRTTTNGLLGYKLGSNAAVMTAITESGAASYNTVAYLATGNDLIPPDITPFSVLYQKGNGADSNTLYALSAVVEQAGVWGLEDDPTATNLPLPSAKYAIHNGAYYSNSPWSLLNAQIGMSGSCAYGFTYVGNGTTQTITVAPLPFHFLWVRPLSGGTNNGYRWLATGLTGHLDAKDGCNPATPINVFWDAVNQVSKFTVTGLDPDINANGVTYQCIAFCDPSSQYNLCGAYDQIAATTNSNHSLYVSTFNPQIAFTQFETTASQSNVIRMCYKGVGSAVGDGVRFDGTSLTNFLTFGSGLIVSNTNANFAVQTTYSVWRTSNGTLNVPIQITSYVGNGTSPRNITLVPTSGVFPLFALVIPHNATIAIFRDPSHAGNNSGDATTSNNTITTGITAGAIDQITVGSSLNTNGIIYDVFIITGSSTGWSNGGFCITNPNGQIILPPPPDIFVVGNGGLLLGETSGIVSTLTLLKDISGIYTLVPGKTDDTLYDRQTGQTNVEVAIPNPQIITGYIGG